MTAGTHDQNWQLITMLPTIAHVVSGMLEGAAEQHQLLASAPPYNLDNATLDRVERGYRDGLDGRCSAAHSRTTQPRQRPNTTPTSPYPPRPRRNQISISPGRAHTEG